VRRRSVHRQNSHRRHRRDGVERNGQHSKSHKDVNPRVLDRDVVQPHDPAFTVRNLGAFVVVGFEVTMRNGARMVDVGFVDVLRRDHSRHSEPRYQCQPGDLAPERSHTARIMVSLKGHVNRAVGIEPMARI
jgi:hypothetical protein